MIDFLLENLLLIPFLFITYLVLEILESRAGGALERGLGRTRCLGPLVGSFAGAIPQCGFSAAAASFFSGGAITAGTLIAVFLSTSDELIPVLISEKAPLSLILKILAVKVSVGLVVGFSINFVLSVFGKGTAKLRVGELCAHSRCCCTKGNGVVRSAFVHTIEIFVFIVFISGLVNVLLWYLGEDGIRSLILNEPWYGEAIAGLLGLIPNCAVSVSGAQIYLKGGMSAGALMSMSLSGAGVGLLVLFRTNRHIWQNIAIMLCVYVSGVVFGRLAGFVF
ncbi:MAG: arsenic efflux protein [Kiritimatiellae bacterium]|nr:arsenic efflux protein [Kiritimatiellia bacterium]